MCRAARCGNSPTNRIRKNVQNFWLCRRMRRTPGRTTMQHGGGTDRTAAPQGPCPLPSTARRTGIGSRDEKRSKVSRSGAFVRLCRPKAPASRPWIHDALSLLSPLARRLRRLTTAARPCGTRAALRQRMLPPRCRGKTVRLAQCHPHDFPSACVMAGLVLLLYL